MAIYNNMFPSQARPKREEDEPYVYRLRPILDQLKISKTPTENQVGTVFSVLSGTSTEVAPQFRCPYITLDEFIEELKSNLLFDRNISQLKVATCNSI